MTSGPPQELTFGVSGKLWHGNLVLYDRLTRSLWTQLDGRAIQGPARGRRLQHVHSEYTSWAAWRAAHPETVVLARSGEISSRLRARYAWYLADPDFLFLPGLAKGVGRIRPKNVVFGITIDGDALAVEQSLLERRGIVNAVVASTPVALLHDRATGFVKAVDRRLGDRIMILAPLPDHDPRERFRDLLSGETHRAEELGALRVDRAFWYAWSRAHQHSRVLVE